LKVSKFAGVLLIPYLLWVSFATLLNFSLWILNL
jgi:tryptophan-rich sensory protein